MITPPILPSQWEAVRATAAPWADLAYHAVRARALPAVRLVRRYPSRAGGLTLVLLLGLGLSASAVPHGPRPGAGPRVVAPPVPRPAQLAPRGFTVLGSGDVLIHTGLWEQAKTRRGYDFGPLFARVAPAVRTADLAICHLETPVGRPNGPFTNYPLFNVPPQVVTTLADIGYDSCSTASNHSLDQHEAGVARTLAAMDRAGLRHTGTARSRREAARLNLLTVNGVTVAHLSYTFSFNGIPRPEGKEWLANELDPAAVIREARRARAAGAAVVIVSIHWGPEYQHEPDDLQVRVARRLLAAPEIDLILGHHSHVVQPLERIGGKWVAYGMGNEVAWQDQAQDTRDGILPVFRFSEVAPGEFRVTRVEVRPVHMWLDGGQARLYDIVAALRDPRVSAPVKASCRASLRRTLAVLDDRGAMRAGLVVAKR